MRLPLIAAVLLASLSAPASSVLSHTSPYTYDAGERLALRYDQPRRQTEPSAGESLALASYKYDAASRAPGQRTYDPNGNTTHAAGSRRSPCVPRAALPLAARENGGKHWQPIAGLPVAQRVK